MNGIKIHYVIGGTGEPLVLVHGFGQNWFMWNRLLPELSKHFTVIAPDLRGLGESDKPKDGYDKKTMAYAYAAQFGNETKKVAFLDALLPGIEPVWSNMYHSLWWFGFFARPISGDLVSGKAGEFLTDFWPIVGYVKDPFTKQETDEFIRAYSTPGSTTGSVHWFGAFPQDAIDNLEFKKHKLKMPVLAMGAEKSAASYLKALLEIVAGHVTETTIRGAGHWIVQEQTEQVQKGLLAFFAGK